MNETDLELLETYLDGELPMSEAEGLWRRLAIERELSAELDRLRASRASRIEIWGSGEPTDLETAIFVNQVKNIIRKRHGLETVRRALIYVTAAAACIAIGFNIGWVAHVPGPASVAQSASPDLSAVAIHDTNGNLVGVQRFATPQEASDFARDLNTSPQSQRDLGQNIVPASDDQVIIP